MRPCFPTRAATSQSACPANRIRSSLNKLHGHPFMHVTTNTHLAPVTYSVVSFSLQAATSPCSIHAHAHALLLHLTNKSGGHLLPRPSHYVSPYAQQHGHATDHDLFSCQAHAHAEPYSSHISSRHQGFKVGYKEATQRKFSGWPQLQWKREGEREKGWFSWFGNSSKEEGGESSVETLVHSRSV